jgi:hypothetical protein
VGGFETVVHVEPGDSDELDSITNSLGRNGQDKLRLLVCRELETRVGANTV